MIDYLKRSWAVVNLDSIAHNAREIKKILSPGCMLMAVVKADAYGHGDKHVAAELALLGADWFGVSNLEEAISLRSCGITQPVLVLAGTPCEHASLLGEYSITQTVHSSEYAMQLQEAANAANVVLDVHVKIDTGMSRIGFIFDNACAGRSHLEILALAEYKNLRAKGIFTHFACADEADPVSFAYTKKQFAAFCSAVSDLERDGLQFELKHCCNSAGALTFPEAHMDMARCGIALYGLSPGRDCGGKISLKPAMSLYSVVSMVKEIAGGANVSYGRSYTSRRKIKVATVPVGYADGYTRDLSNKARMLVNGCYANVIGRVCMDQLMLDVTHIEKIETGDIVTIAGCDGGLSLGFDEMAELSGTISYEKVCLIGKRVPRVYSRGGKEIGVADYVRQCR